MEQEVVILMSTYNGERYLAEQLASIAAQKGVDWHLLVRDDGSTDSTVQILKDFQGRYPQRVQIYTGENLGYALSFTQLIKEGLERFPEVGWFAFADQDDVWMEDKLAAGLEYISAHSKGDGKHPIVYSSNTSVVEEDLSFRRFGWRPREVRPTPERALVQSFATGCTMLFNRRAAEIYNKYHPKQVRVHDFMMYQIGVFFGEYLWDPTPHILYRQHGDNQIGRQQLGERMHQRATSANYKKRVLEGQTEKFFNSFGPLMSNEQWDMVDKFLNYRDSWASTLGLFFNFKIGYTTFERDFFYRLKILLRGV